MKKEYRNSIVLVEVKNGKLNGDPENNNRPREDKETGQHLVTDVCVKKLTRKAMKMLGVDNFDSYQPNEDSEKTTISTKIDGYRKNNNIDDPKKDVDYLNLRNALLKDFIDLRMYGGALTTKRPIQLEGTYTPSFVTKSINKAKTVTISSTSENKTNDNKDGGSMFERTVTEYAIFPIIFKYNPYNDHNVFDTDCDDILKYFVKWFDIHRSIPRLGTNFHMLIDIITKDSEDGKCGNNIHFDDLIEMNISSILKSSTDFTYNFTKLINKLKRLRKYVDRIEMFTLETGDDNIIEQFDNLITTLKNEGFTVTLKEF